MSSPAPRRSTRAPKPNPKYEDEVQWNDDTLRLLRADSDTSGNSSDSEVSLPRTDPDIEMVDVDLEDPAEEDEGEEEEEEEEDGEENIVLGDRHVTIEFPTPSPAISDDDLPARNKPRFSKGSFRMATKNMYPQVFGPDLEDLYPILQSRDLWHLNPRDLVFPSRATLREALRLDAKGEYLERKQMESTTSISSHHQQIEHLTSDQAMAARYLELGEPHVVVLGPSDAGRKHTLQHHQSVQVANAWLRGPGNGETCPDTSTINDAYHKGWILNLGARPQSLAWAPSSTDDQFLAVTFRCSKSQRDTAPPRESKLAPAFSPSPAYSSRVEIWRIKARPGSAEESAQIDHHIPPRLIQVLCTRYGNILKMEWLPVLDTDKNHSLCILASDGSIRIINLNLDDQESPLYLHIKVPQLTAEPPTTTIFTSFTLPSPYDLLATDASGAVHLFSLLSDSASLTPYSTLQPHMTYITAITSIPSRPHYIATSSAAGEHILTDLRSPTIDRIRVQTARLPTRNLSYLPFTRTFLTTLDSASRYEAVPVHGSILVSHSIRDFKMSKPIMRLPRAGGISTSLGASQFHSIVLVGNAAGSVFSCNYVRRSLPIGNSRKDKIGAWMVKAFECEWRALTEMEVDDRRKERGSGSELKNGTTRSAADNGAHDTTNFSPTDATTVPSPSSSQNPPPTLSIQQHLQQQHPQHKDAIDLFHGPSTPLPGLTRFTEGHTPERVIVSNLDTKRSSAVFARTSKSKSKSKAKSKLKGKSGLEGKTKSRATRKSTDTGEDDYDHIDTNNGEGEVDSDSDDDDGDNNDDDAVNLPIYHEEQSVTAITWNGNVNPRFASWVAVAWGSGIVRVSDLGHDVV